jgi:hypothetical protein
VAVLPLPLMFGQVVLAFSFSCCNSLQLCTWLGSRHSMTLSSGNWPGIGSGIWLGCRSSIRHGIGIPSATVLGDVS